MNQCIGHRNHRYFFLFMAYTVVGAIFIMTFGIGIGFDVLWLGNVAWQENEQLKGALVRYNLSGHIFLVTEADYESIGISPANHNLPITELNDPMIYRAVTFMAIILFGKNLSGIVMASYLFNYSHVDCTWSSFDMAFQSNKSWRDECRESHE